MPLQGVALLVSETILIAACYLLVWFLDLKDEAQLLLFYDNGWLQIALVVAIEEAGFSFMRMGATVLPRSRLLLIQRICLVLGIAFLLEAFSGYLNLNLALPPNTMVFGSLLVLVVVPLWRQLLAAVHRGAATPQRLLLVGSSATAHQLLALTADPALNLKVTGWTGSAASNPLPAPYLGSFDATADVLRKHEVDRVVVAFGSSTPSGFPVRSLLGLQMNSIVEVEDAASVIERLAGRIPVRELDPSRLLLGPALAPAQHNLFVQQTVYLLMRLLALLLAPFLLLLAALVKLVSPGAVFLREPRTGWRGDIFIRYRFRPDTAAGRLLRRLRLDQTPQLFNVIRGDMALVGPRPERPEMIEALSRHIPFYRYRLCIRPGCTGWAQINRSTVSTGDSLAELEYDCFYIKHMSPALDAFILLRALRGQTL